MRDVVDMVTSEPPPLRYGVDDIVASGERVRRRRRLVRAVSGAAAVVVALGAAVTVAVPAFSERDGADRGNGTGTSTTGSVGAPDTSPVGPFTFSFGAYRVGRLQVAAPVSVSTAYQLAPVYADGLVSNDRAVDGSAESTGRDKSAPGYVPDPNAAKNLWAYLTVYRAGAYDATRLAGARPVTVGDRPGLEASTTDGNWAMGRTLAWQYADNAWAVISALSDDIDHPSSDELRQLAAGLRTDVRTPVKLPVTLTYLPAGFTLTEAAMRTTTGLNGLAMARNGDHAGLLFSRPALPTTGLTGPFTGPDGMNPAGSFAVHVVPAASSNQPTAAAGVTCMNGFCNRYFDGGTVLVQVSSEGQLPDTEMTKILESTTLGNVRDEGTWAEVSASIPA